VPERVILAFQPVVIAAFIAACSAGSLAWAGTRTPDGRSVATRGGDAAEDRTPPSRAPLFSGGTIVHLGVLPGAVDSYLALARRIAMA
jgi:hypothetical protein